MRPIQRALNKVEENQAAVTGGHVFGEYMIVKRAGMETEHTDLMQGTSAEHMNIYQGVGSPVNAKVSEEDLDELLKQAKLDWEVKVADGIAYGDNYQFKSDRDRIIYRDNPDGGQPIHLGTTSTRWLPFQNNQVVKSFINFCKNSNLEMERLGFLDEGRTIFCVAKINESFVLPGEDLVEGKLLLTNSNRAGRGARVDLMCPRMICTNQLVLPVKIAGQVITHTSSYSEVRVQRILESAKTGFGQFKTDAEFLAETNIDDKVAHSLVVKILGNVDKGLDDQPKAVKEVLDLYHGEGIGSSLLSAYSTAWGLTQAVTEYYNHHSSRRGGVNGHINSLWLGSKRSKQESALKQIVTVLR